MKQKIHPRPARSKSYILVLQKVNTYFQACEKYLNHWHQAFKTHYIATYYNMRPRPANSKLGFPHADLMQAGPASSYVPQYGNRRYDMAGL